MVIFKKFSSIYNVYIIFLIIVMLNLETFSFQSCDPIREDYYTKAFSALQMERDSMKIEIDALKSNYNSLKNLNVDLISKNDLMKTEIENLKSMYNSLFGKNSDIKWFDSYYAYYDGTMAMDCYEYKKNLGHKAISGIYKISTINDVVYCDQTNHGGGWTIIIKTRETDNLNYDLTWAEYKVFFGDLKKSFWIGLDNMNKLTALGPTEMYMDVIFKGLSYEYKYSYINIGNEAQSYIISIPDSVYDGMKFTTKDKDNDIYSTGNCATVYIGGWWYEQCYSWKLVGDFSNNNKRQGVSFSDLDASLTQSISYGVMKIRRKDLF
jgi:hypothetical protein